MADKHEKVSGEKGILARTATYTTKRAKRAQTKLKQKVGKGDETKDEVFDEFVQNFNKQQAAVHCLNTELANYSRCITAMQVAADNFAGAMKAVYEPEWSSRESVFDLFKLAAQYEEGLIICVRNVEAHIEQSNANWTNLSKKLKDEVLEPLMSYQKPFAEVKTKIQKRARKLVDYDHSRHTVDTLRAKGATKTSDTKKLNLAEEDYQKAKEVFIELTSELYDELPALYDSRIGFYATSFQSIFTLEEVFHRESAKLKHELNDLMDQLITDFSAGTFSTRKPFSAGLETISNNSEKEDNETKLSSGSLTQFYDVAVPADDNSEDVDNSDGELPIQPVRPAPCPPLRPTTPPHLPDDHQELFSTPNNTELGEDEERTEENDEDEDEEEEHCTELVNVTSHEPPDANSEEVIAYRNTLSPENSDRSNLVVPKSLYKVMATHRYTPEDDDELSFERGDVIHVVSYDDPDEQDDGWLMGVLDKNGLKGVFPENFSSRVP